MIEDIANSTNHQLTGTQNVVKSINEIAKIAKQSSSNSQQTAAATHENDGFHGRNRPAAAQLASCAGNGTTVYGDAIQNNLITTENLKK